MLKKLGSSLIAAASSFNVSSVPGAESIMPDTAAEIAAAISVGVRPVYASEVQAVEPLPIFSLRVSVSKPNSPTASVGLVDVHWDAIPRLA